MYNISGNFWELPQLNTGRWSHGCGYYVREAQVVTIGLRVFTTLMILSQILVVAGGTGEEFESLQSTEVLILGDWSEWQFAADLPGPKVMMMIVMMMMNGVAGVSQLGQGG